MASVLTDPRLERCTWPSELRIAFSEALHRGVNESGLPPAIQERIEGCLRGIGGPLNPQSSSRLPLLAALSYESAGGTRTVVAAQLAAAMGFILTAADVLDDLQDGDSPPEYADRSAEMIFALLLLGHRALANTTPFVGDKGRIATALGNLDDLWLSALGGQHTEIMYSSWTTVSAEQALDATAAKSGSLGRCAASVGAILSTDDAEEVEMYGYFGALVGVVSQLINDVDGVRPEGGPSTDLALGRKTLPVAYVLEVPEGVSAAADWARNAILEHSSEDRDFSETDEAMLREAIYDSGAVHYSWINAAAHHAHAIEIFEQIRARRPSSRLDLLL